MRGSSFFSSSEISHIPRTEEGKTAKARRVVRNNNFTQQTNALDVDKHMCVFRAPSCVIEHVV